MSENQQSIKAQRYDLNKSNINDILSFSLTISTKVTRCIVKLTADLAYDIVHESVRTHPDLPIQYSRR